MLNGFEGDNGVEALCVSVMHRIIDDELGSLPIVRTRVCNRAGIAVNPNDRVDVRVRGQNLSSVSDATREV